MAPAPVAERVAEATPAPAPTPEVTPRDEVTVAAHQGGSSAAAAEKFKAWGVVHAFLGQPVVGGRAISNSEAIAFTKDNHVGITTDGGASWGFTRHTSGDVRAVGGAPGGPYVTVGKYGYMAISRDGKSWSDLPRFTEDELVDVAVGSGGIVAVGKKGQWVRFDAEGRTGSVGILPDKFKARTVVALSGRFVAINGRKAYAAADGQRWTALDAAPELNNNKKATTRRGLCSVTRVGKGSGVSCDVKGVAWGLSSSETLVYDKKTLAFTQDGGSTWAIQPAPFSGIEGVVGNPGGPMFVYGAKGAMAMSRDGKSWSEVAINAQKTLRAGLVDGSMVLIVGDGGTIVQSKDGGETWSVVPSPVNKALKQVAKVDGRYIVPLGKGGIESPDGVTWIELVDPTVLEAIAKPGRPGKCEGRMPSQSEICTVQRSVTTPLGIPNVKSIDFIGDAGLAMGDAGLVAVTADGGASWKWHSGFTLRDLNSFDAKGQVVVAVGGKSVIVSTNGGKSFREAQLPKKAGRVFATYISDGTVFAAGDGGTILRSTGDLQTWELMNTGEKNRTRYVGLFSVGGVLYASGQRGELFRAEAGGAVWFQIATGVSDPIQAMTGEGSTVLAVTYAGRKGGNLMLRSDDDGRHFYVLREISHSGSVDRFELASGTLLYRDRSSKDFGATWTSSGDDYWAGSVEVGDGSGLRLVDHASTYVRDRFYVVAGKDDWTIIDAFSTKGSRVTCDNGTGCWMIDGGQVYRPL
ncbi:MAG: hypothetical protein EP329_08085 [Deltaproteobacteria bacterium]|nr:MAG: hypothetical protein EP329_08085 [Deltaproteobacteria bacterium]